MFNDVPTKYQHCNYLVGQAAKMNSLHILEVPHETIVTPAAWLQI